MLAVQATHHHEFIQNPSSFLPVARAVTPRQRNHQLVSCRHADLPHVRPHRCTPVGSKLDEATGRPLGAFQARQCGHHPDCRAICHAASPKKRGRPAGPPMVRWSVQEIRRLASRLAQRRIKPAFVIAWSAWRRCHQAMARGSPQICPATVMLTRTETFKLSADPLFVEKRRRPGRAAAVGAGAGHGPLPGQARRRDREEAQGLSDPPSRRSCHTEVVSWSHFRLTASAWPIERRPGRCWRPGSAATPPAPALS